MTPQEIFDTAVVGIIKQGNRSVSKLSTSCMYRGDNNMRCAVGWVIPDDVYTPDMENKRVGDLIKKYKELPAYITKNIELLDVLQQVHDKSNLTLERFIEGNLLIIDNQKISTINNSSEYVIPNFFRFALEAAKIFNLSTTKVEEAYYARTQKEVLS